MPIDDFFAPEGDTAAPAPVAAPDTATARMDSFFSDEPAPPSQPTEADKPFLESVVRDFAEGSVAPFVGAWHAGRGLLAEPAIGMLPIEGQDTDLKRAEELGWKGAAFWGSMLAGGGAASIGKSILTKAALGGAAGAGSFELARQLPEVFHQETSLPQAAKDIGTAAAFGMLTGGVLAKAPAAIGLAGRAAEKTGRFAGRTMMNSANLVIDRIPGGPKARDDAAQFVRLAYKNLWDKFFTSGQELLRKVGLDPLKTQLMLARGTAALTGGRFVSAMNRNFAKLSDSEVGQVSKLMETVDLLGDVAPKHVEGFSDRIVAIATNEAERLRDMGTLLQKAGVQIYDPDSGFHSFILRKNYIPHRFVDADQYLTEGSDVREATIEQVMRKLQLRRDKAEEWVTAFGKRVGAEQEGILTDRPVSFGTAHFLQGRSLELPGYETDLRKILPQYYEYASRRLANHTFFGPTHPVQEAVQKAGEQLEMFPSPAAQQTVSEIPSEQLFLEGLESFRGHGMPKEEIARKLSERQIVRAREARAIKELRRTRAIEQRYPRAFAQLEGVEDVTQRELARRVVGRQLGAIEEDQFSRGVLPALAKIEVVSKLALGAIAQPSQMLSAVVRTGYKGAFKNFWKTVSGDPEALDFALRTGAILRGVVRHSEQSLTGQAGQDFLEKVYFTQMDLKSRVFGALQGASFAQHQARKLHELTMQAPSTMLRNQMARIESKLAGLGLDPAAIVQRGGHLTEDELLLAGQKVASNVNFWGDSLSLPEFFRGPFGRYLTMFKSFGFQQGKLFKDHIVKPAMEWYRSDGKRGDIGPLIRFASLTPAGGEIIADLKKTARGKTRGDLNFAERVMENVSNGAGFGLTWDAIEATRFGLGGTFGWATGPIGTELAKGATNLGAAVRGQPRNLAKQILETGLPASAAALRSPLTPLIAAGAPALSNILLPPQERP